MQSLRVSKIAKKNLVKVPILKGNLFLMTQLGKFGGGFVLIKPACGRYWRYRWWCKCEQY